MKNKSRNKKLIDLFLTLTVLTAIGVFMYSTKNIHSQYTDFQDDTVNITYSKDGDDTLFTSLY